MNRQERRANKKISQELAKEHPKELTVVPRHEWPLVAPFPTQVWVSQRYMVQLYDEGQQKGVLRLSVSRTTQNGKGRWNDGLTWDELQAIKRDVGYGDYYAIEIYPRDRDVVNDANMRHLWILPAPLPVGWFSSEGRS